MNRLFTSSAFFPKWGNSVFAILIVLFLSTGSKISVSTNALPSESLLHSDSLQAKKHFDLAREYQKQNLDSAAKYYQESLSLYQAEKLFNQATKSSSRLAAVYEELNKIDQAYQTLLQASNWVKKNLISDTASIIDLNKVYGAIHTRRDEFDSSFIKITDNIDLIKKFFKDTRPTILADNYFNLANALSEYELLDRALSYYDSAAIIVAEQLGEESDYMASIISNKVGIHVLMNDFEEAIFLNEQSLKLKQQVLPSGHEDYIFYYYNTAFIYIERNDGDDDNLKALENIDQGMKVLLGSTSPDPYYLVYFYYAYIQTYQNLQDYASAKAYAKKADSLNTLLYGDDYEEKGYLLQQLGELSLMEGNWLEADSLLNASMDFYQEFVGGEIKELAQVYSLQGDLHKEQGAYERALQSYQKAISFFDTDVDPNDFFQTPKLADIYTSKFLLDLLSKKAQTLNQFFLNEHQPELLTTALDTYVSAIGYIKSSRKRFRSDSPSKIAFNARTSNLYEEALATAIQLYDLEKDDFYLKEALKIADSRKYGLLLDDLQKVKVRAIAKIPEEIIQKEQNLTATINFIHQKLLDQDPTDTITVERLERELFQLKNDHQSLARRIEVEFPSYYRLKYSVADLEVEQLVESIPSHTLLIEYFMADSQIYLFLVGQDQIDYLVLPYPEKLSQQIQALASSLKDRNLESYGKNAFNVYTQIVHPALERLSNRKSGPNHLIIIPDGILGYIPFEALLQSAPEADQGYKSLDYLIRNYQISYHYSASLLAYTFSDIEMHTKPSFLGFAPAFINKTSTQYLSLNEPTRAFMDTLTALPDAEKEVNAIAKLLNGQAQIGTAATEYNFKRMAGNYQILHLASHSIIDDAAPLYSRLLFDNEQDSIDDGFLHTYELYNMDFQADLVTLSSCNTGVGRLYKGEGIMSLARGFMYAGVPNLVMSLWSVSDKPTKDLMTFFYEELKNGENKSAALRKAKLRYLEQADNVTADPYYWGSFVYLGQVESETEPPGTLIWLSIVFLFGLGLVGWVFMRKPNRKMNFR